MADAPAADATPEQLELMEQDLYAVLNEGLEPELQVSPASSARDLQKAYRKQALRWHPDKNRSDPQAPLRYDTLRRVHELLSNEHLKHQYDARAQARAARAAELQKQDAVRRRMREALERREQQGQRARDFQRQRTAHQLAEEENLRVIRQMQAAGAFRPATMGAAAVAAAVMGAAATATATGSASTSSAPPQTAPETAPGPLAQDQALRVSWSSKKTKGDRLASDLLLDPRAAHPAFLPRSPPDAASLRRVFSGYGAAVREVLVNPELRRAMVWFQDPWAAAEVAREFRLRPPPPGEPAYWRLKLSPPPAVDERLARPTLQSPPQSQSQSQSQPQPKPQPQPQDPFDFTPAAPPGGSQFGQFFQGRPEDARSDFPGGLGDPVFRQHLEDDQLDELELAEADGVGDPFPELRQGMEFSVYEVATMQRVQDFVAGQF